MIDKLWKSYFGTGWNYGEEPSKRECFKAGIEAVVKHYNSESKFIVSESADLDKINIEPGFIPFVQKKKTTPEIIKDWQDKFDQDKK